MRRCATVLCVFGLLSTIALAAASAGETTPRLYNLLQARRRLKKELGDEPKTVPELNVTQYLGRWYQVYQDATTAYTFQFGSYCATADYGNLPAVPGELPRISVSNREHYGSKDGPQKNVSGYAYRANATEAPGKLTVYLHGDNASPFPAPYWVLQLGPIVNGLYDYAVVSDDLRATLFVLTRDVDRFDSDYKNFVLVWLARNGFNMPWNKPMPLEQANCTYFH